MRDKYDNITSFDLGDCTKDVSDMGDNPTVVYLDTSSAGEDVFDTGTSPMNAAMDALKKARIGFEKMTAYHLKIGDWNYYPGRGTLHRDGEDKARKRVSLDEVLRIVRAKRR